MPGSLTIKFPVSVNKGIFLLASSKKIYSSGTPYLINLSFTLKAIFFSYPVTPSIDRNSITFFMFSLRLLVINKKYHNYTNYRIKYKLQLILAILPMIFQLFFLNFHFLSSF